MTFSNQRWCIWSGLGAIVFLLLGFLLAGFLPPPSPAYTAEQIQQIFVDRNFRIRTGMVLCTIGAAFNFTWAAAISVQIRRIEVQGHTIGPLAWAQLTAGAANGLLIVFPVMFWQAIAFRASARSAEISQAINDIASLCFVGVPVLGVLQNILIAVAIFQDKAANPVFPRWLGYFNIWTALAFLPGLACVYFVTGPFAWNGILAWWMGLTVYGIWFAVMIWALLRAATAQQTEATALTSARAAR